MYLMMVDSAGIVYKFVGKHNYKSNKYYEHDCGHVKPIITHYFLYCPILFCAILNILFKMFSKVQKVE